MPQNPHRSQPEDRRAISKTGAGPIGAKKLALHTPSSCVSAKKLAQRARKRQFWAIVSAQGELFRAHTHHQTTQGELFRARDPAHGDFETDNTTARP